jgi:23S rRNA (uracil1939-C5)-methyltransferase
MTEFKIQHMGQHGDGIAKGPFFAPMTLPGEVVTATIDGQDLRNIKVVTPSADRVSPPCRHFRSCGGCQLQHAADDFVANWKQEVVRSTLAALEIKPSLRPIMTSPVQSRRRATFAARRTKKGAMAGFHGRASGVIVEIPDCQLLQPEVMAGLPVAERLAIVGASRKAALAVTVTHSMHGLDVAVENGKPLDGPLMQELAQLCDQMGLARLSWGTEVIAMRTPPTQKFGNAHVTPPAGAFLQATTQGEAALLAAVKDAIGDAAPLIDLFAGSGTFTLPLAQNAAVHAVESDAAMLGALDQGWRMAEGLKPVSTQARDLYRRPLLPDELAKAGAVVLDPPRAGAEAQVIELARSDVSLIAYVSCNPTTFARDVQVLQGAGFVLEWVQVVDQFRWSPHIELVGRLTRNR